MQEQNEKPVVVHVKQHPKHTLLEVLTHMIVGFVLTVAVVYFWFPEVEIFSSINVALTVTAVKFVANYYIRRYFTHKSYEHRHEKT